MKVTGNTLGLLLALAVAVLGVVGFAYAIKADVAELTLRQEFSSEVTAALNRESLSMIRTLNDTDDETEERLDSIERKIAVLEATGR